MGVCCEKYPPRTQVVRAAPGLASARGSSTRQGRARPHAGRLSPQQRQRKRKSPSGCREAFRYHGAGVEKFPAIGGAFPQPRRRSREAAGPAKPARPLARSYAVLPTVSQTCGCSCRFPRPSDRQHRVHLPPGALPELRSEPPRRRPRSPARFPFTPPLPIPAGSSPPCPLNDRGCFSAGVRPGLGFSPARRQAGSGEAFLKKTFIYTS